MIGYSRAFNELYGPKPIEGKSKMNERIQELAEQAGFIPGIMGLNRFTYFDPEKFAELIVRECLSKIENEAMQYAEPVWAIELVNDIKEHFGIEE